MRFDNGIAKKYRRSIDDAFATIIDKGNELHKRIANLVLDSGMSIRVRPVSEFGASGQTGLIDRRGTNDKIADGFIGIKEALGEIHITIAEETIDTGGKRGCEGTLVHEGRHAYDFAQTIASFSEGEVNPLSIFDPTLYELEFEAHKISGEYMLLVNRDEYLDEGLGLMILCRDDIGTCLLSHEGIHRRLFESYGLSQEGNQGPRASELLGLKMK